MKKIFLNNNQLSFDSLPANISKWINLEVFHAAYNRFELVPEALARCPKLRKIKLNNNQLITVPDTFYLLPDLKELDLRNNPDLVLPPKPCELKKSRLAYYNIDFSLEHQAKLVGNVEVITIIRKPVVRSKVGGIPQLEIPGVYKPYACFFSIFF